MRCVGEVKRSLELTDRARRAREQWDRLLNDLDKDGFRRLS